MNIIKTVNAVALEPRKYHQILTKRNHWVVPVMTIAFMFWYQFLFVHMESPVLSVSHFVAQTDLGQHITLEKGVLSLDVEEITIVSTDTSTVVLDKLGEFNIEDFPEEHTGAVFTPEGIWLRERVSAPMSFVELLDRYKASPESFASFQETVTRYAGDSLFLTRVVATALTLGTTLLMAIYNILMTAGVYLVFQYQRGKPLHNSGLPLKDLLFVGTAPLFILTWTASCFLIARLPLTTWWIHPALYLLSAFYVISAYEELEKKLPSEKEKEQ